MDKLDLEVKTTNTLLNQYAKWMEDIFIAWNSNLRNPDFFYDAKYMKDSCIARFAANIKRALNKAYDRQYKQGSWRSRQEDDSSRFNNIYGENSRKITYVRFINNKRQEMENNLKAELIRKITLALS